MGDYALNITSFSNQPTMMRWLNSPPDARGDEKKIVVNLAVGAPMLPGLAIRWHFLNQLVSIRVPSEAALF